VTVQDRYGCQEEAVISLQDPELFVLNTIPDQSVLLGDEIQVNTFFNFPLGSVSWDNVSGLSCGNCENPILIPFESGKYIISATNLEGCIAMDSFMVEVDKQALFYLPNIFTPNDDGLNDVFYLSSYKSSVMVIDDFYVYDRWGNLAFEAHNINSNDLNSGWNPDKSTLNGVYAYIVNLRLIDQTIHQLLGDITILR
jgi:gliding motility-associated-like protein